MEKYKELYDLAREAVAQAEARFDTIDSKASMYLSVLTFLVGGATFFAKWVADQQLPPSDFLDWTLVAMAVAIAACIALAWFRVFAILRVDRIRILPLDRGTIDFFDRNTLVDVYYALARGYSAAWQINRDVNEEKLRKLTSGYRLIMVTMVLVLVACALYGARAWLRGAA